MRQCNNSNCVLANQICNGIDDCHDNSDEIDCPEGCPPGKFQCPLGQTSSTRCISNSQVCDGRNDCAMSTGSAIAADEMNCSNWTCPINKFQCASGHCIDASYYCDEDFDCPDRSDEPAFTCRNRPCPLGWNKCTNSSGSYKCIHSSRFCDGHRDCTNGEDEALSQCPICHATGDFKCANNRCIMLSLRCNSVNDCGDNSDESPTLCRRYLLPF
jgi:hypothetical protein